jgi:anti-anti-sigma factor
MAIEHWSEDLILVTLAKEPQLGEELEVARSIVNDREDCDVVLDFSEVDILTSSSIARLLKLRKAVKDCHKHLVLTSVSSRTKSIFALTGLDGVFEFVEDKTLALAGLQMNS